MKENFKSILFDSHINLLLVIAWIAFSTLILVSVNSPDAYNQINCAIFTISTIIFLSTPISAIGIKSSIYLKILDYVYYALAILGLILYSFEYEGERLSYQVKSYLSSIEALDGRNEIINLFEEEKEKCNASSNADVKNLSSYKKSISPFFNEMYCNNINKFLELIKNQKDNGDYIEFIKNLKHEEVSIDSVDINLDGGFTISHTKEDHINRNIDEMEMYIKSIIYKDTGNWIGKNRNLVNESQRKNIIIIYWPYFILLGISLRICKTNSEILSSILRK